MIKVVALFNLAQLAIFNVQTQSIKIKTSTEKLETIALLTISDVLALLICMNMIWKSLSDYIN